MTPTGPGHEIDAGPCTLTMADAPGAEDATALARAFASGSSDPRAAMEVSLARIERLDPLLGACNEVAERGWLLAAADAAAARWRAGAPCSPLDGIPFGVKANIAVRGLHWHAGIAALRTRVADEDAVCVHRLRSAGLIPVAVLNMHEAALGETSDNPAFVTTRNPWAPERIPGGSSGGSAAAVTSGMLPLALGTDSLGSVRLPSALCGVVGFKPAHGDIPTAGVEPLSPGLDHIGIHARSVRDVRMLLPLLRDGPIIGLARHDTPPLARWLLRDTVEPKVTDAFETAMDRAGIELRAAETADWSNVDLSALRRTGLLLCERHAAQNFATFLAERPDGFSEDFRRLVAWGTAQRPSKVREAKQHLARMATALRENLRHGLLACPTSPFTAPATDVPVPKTLANFTAPAAIAGVPAISVPAPIPAGELPVGLQVAGMREDEVLAAAARLFPGTAAIADPGRHGSLSRSPDTRGSK